MPVYSGGNKAFLKFVAKNFRHPKQEVLHDVFVVVFVIDERGNLVAPRIKGKIESDLTKAERGMLSVFGLSDKWSPGICEGKNVPVRVIMPVRVCY
ncbi:hypothetical protein FUAX_53470 (plasmid) [Fulvitalea axinellae]|uniref:TonB C-terminal domain-containing protein n=1 Tax=Fulvitalea axinellae TaxID=1182444 RepID=A0AAU9DK58_9BACT|nr:hypothetical protein FUAX_53470 [Fulvitalea axinellae]